MKIYIVMGDSGIIIATDDETQASHMLKSSGTYMEVWQDGRYLETLESVFGKHCKNFS